MSLPIALALVAALIAIFAVIAAFATYTRLRTVERAVFSADTARLADDTRTVPPELRPRTGERATLVLLLESGCPTCAVAIDALAGRDRPGMRSVAVFAAEASVDTYGTPSTVERVASPDLWQFLYEGYAPCLYVVGADGRITDRRFLYTDTDVPALIDTFVSATETLGSVHAV
ncbi:hypothetical protein [Actinokineospora sp.]|uniref:hypothetical protein n=1 Tax=Actinokineospora sp. TaxID=1872133 RepID=UPI003D6C4BC0